MAGFIGIDITGIETLKQRLLKLPREAQDAGVEEANKYLVEKMRAYPPKATPGTPFIWASDRQRKAVMAKLREQGGPPYQRTQELRNGWKTVGSGYQQIIANETPYADYVMGQYQQPGHQARGWQVIGTILQSNARKVLEKFDAGVKKAIRKLKL